MENKKDAAFAASFLFVCLRASAARDPLLLFFSFFRGGRPQETVEGRVGRPCRGVSRMDAATELTWTYLQRPLHGLPTLPNA